MDKNKFSAGRFFVLISLSLMPFAALAQVCKVETTRIPADIPVNDAGISYGQVLEFGCYRKPCD